METEPSASEAEEVMSRRPRNYIACLSLWYEDRFPLRPPGKENFHDEVEAMLNMVMAQIEALYRFHNSGPFPLVYPPQLAEGIEPQPSVRSKGKIEFVE